MLNLMDKEKFVEFKKLYKESVKKKLAIFIFDGKEVYVGYAKYMIQYMENRTKQK